MAKEYVLIANRNHVIVKDTGINGIWMLLGIDNTAFINLMQSNDSLTGLKSLSGRVAFGL
ncbi:hypothetical protein A3760_21705 [Oleiphilus sp. HI0122]|nr:hypothetical protein A3760_21705 [Oleiphilus sp. HI0122]